MYASGYEDGNSEGSKAQQMEEFAFTKPLSATYLNFLSIFTKPGKSADENPSRKLQKASSSGPVCMPPCGC